MAVHSTGGLQKPPESTAHLQVLEFSSDDAECVVAGVMIDADLGDARGRAARQPFLLNVTIQHH